MDGSGVDLHQARRLAVDVAHEAGALLRGRARGHLGARPKGGSGDVVLALDLAAEELILRRLRAAFPGHRIVAEESGVHEADSAWTWLVDPLDGTNNVAVGLSTYVVGLALCDRGQPVLGVVHDPITEQTWSAVLGAGADGPNGRLRPVSRPTPHGPVLGWTQGHGVARSDDTARALKLVLEMHSYRLLQLWAPLLCWVMLARGDIDGFVGYHAEAVDLPAGSLLAAEAGLAIRTLDDRPFEDMVAETAERSFVAGHPDRIPELLALVRAAFQIRPAVSALPLPLTGLARAD
ncbi:MAG TPA: inositol monophosphatase family protein [Mycobacteriales bacterium]|nr:inositol monophosphatase family protein [Mycobacteriales bacterium]